MKDKKKEAALEELLVVACAEKVKAYCESRKNCTGCPIHKSTADRIGYCRVGMPFEWEVGDDV